MSNVGDRELFECEKCLSLSQDFGNEKNLAMVFERMFSLCIK